MQDELKAIADLLPSGAGSSQPASERLSVASSATTNAIASSGSTCTTRDPQRRPRRGRDTEARATFAAHSLNQAMNGNGRSRQR